MKFSFKNISPKAFKNKLKVYAVLNNFNGSRSRTDTVVLQALKPDSIDVFEVVFNTKGMIGKNSLSINVNLKLQVEKLYSNNSFTSTMFEVLKDDRNPLLQLCLTDLEFLMVKLYPQILLSALK